MFTEIEQAPDKREDKKVASRNLSRSVTAELFQDGNFAAVAMRGYSDCWQTHAARCLVRGDKDSLTALDRFENNDAKFYSAVTSWIYGDEEKAKALLPKVEGPHAQKLLELILKPKINVLGQLPWTRGGWIDLLGPAKAEGRFDIRNISFHEDDLPNQPNGDIRSYYDREFQPDFFICAMLEWHFVPPNLQQLPCPVFCQTGDYDLHIQCVYPWLRLFDEILVTDPSEWDDVKKLVSVPVSSFPKSFGISDRIPPLHQKDRNIDFYLSGTLLHPYHPDKAHLVHQILGTSGLKLKMINGFCEQPRHFDNLLNSKVCLSYVRHAGALPTRGIEALAMGCVVLAQKESVLTLYAGENEGVVTYDSPTDNLEPLLSRVLGNWQDFQVKAERGAKIMREQFSLPVISAQYLRFLTFLAAKPRLPRKALPTQELYQKRQILEKGWLPSYEFRDSHTLYISGIDNFQRIRTLIDNSTPRSHWYIDAARESVLYHHHRALRKLVPVEEWLSSLQKFYLKGIALFPDSLVLRFNYIRTMLHYGTPSFVSEGLEQLEETLASPVTRWSVDVMEDVFPWDFYPQFFNYREYFDRVMHQLRDGVSVQGSLAELILASLFHYRACYSRYEDFNALSIEELRKATHLDKDFPYYRLTFAKQLLIRGLPSDVHEASATLSRLCDDSLLFLDAHGALRNLYYSQIARFLPFKREKDHYFASRDIDEYLERFKLPPLREILENTESKIQKTNKIFEFIELLENSSPKPDLRQMKHRHEIQEATRIIFLEKQVRQYRVLLRYVQSSQFWKLRRIWLRVKKALGYKVDDLLN